MTYIRPSHLSKIKLNAAVVLGVAAFGANAHIHADNVVTTSSEEQTVSNLDTLTQPSYNKVNTNQENKIINDNFIL